MNISCPECQKELSFKMDIFGHKVKCSGCGHKWMAKDVGMQTILSDKTEYIKEEKDEKSNRQSLPAARMYCSDCGEVISRRAPACPHCGASANNMEGDSKKRKEFDGTAALLSFLIPGLGQLYQGRIASAFLLIMFTPVAYLCFVIPGMIFHVFAILDAGENGRR